MPALLLLIQLLAKAHLGVEGGAMQLSVAARVMRTRASIQLYIAIRKPWEKNTLDLQKKKSVEAVNVNAEGKIVKFFLYKYLQPFH